MNLEERQRFINELVENVRKKLIKETGYMPDEWDGIELRQYISDRFSHVVIKGTMTRGRKRNYNNTILCSDGLLC